MLTARTSTRAVAPQLTGHFSTTIYLRRHFREFGSFTTAGGVKPHQPRTFTSKIVCNQPDGGQRVSCCVGERFVDVVEIGQTIFVYAFERTSAGVA